MAREGILLILKLFVVIPIWQVSQQFPDNLRLADLRPLSRFFKLRDLFRCQTDRGILGDPACRFL